MPIPNDRSTCRFLTQLLPLLAVIASAFLASCDEWDDDDWNDDDDDCHRHTNSVGTVFIHCHDDDDDFGDDENDDDFDDDDDHRFLLAGGGAEVTTVVTDHPIDGVRELFVTLRVVSLVGADSSIEPVFQSDEGRRVDLLSLRGDGSEGGTERLFDILSVRSPLPAGAYVSAIVRIEDPAITLDDGSTVGMSDIDLAADGIIQTDFAQPFAVGPGEFAHLVVDFDVKRSLSSQDGRWIFRPLVLLDIVREPGTGEDRGRVFSPADLVGVVDGIDETTRSFRLTLTEERGSIPIDVVPSALILNESLDRGAFSSIENGDLVSLRGFLHTSGELDAHSIVIGETIRKLGRIARVTPVAEGWRLEVGEVDGKSLELFVPPSALLSERRRGPVDGSVLATGRLVRLTLRPRQNQPLAAVRLDVELTDSASDGTAPPEPQGRIRRFDSGSRILTLESGATVRLEAAVRILAIEDQGDVLVERALSFDELGSQWKVVGSSRAMPVSVDSGAVELLVVSPATNK